MEPTIFLQTERGFWDNTITAVPEYDGSRYPIVHGTLNLRNLDGTITPVVELTTLIPEGPDKAQMEAQAEVFKSRVLMKYVGVLKRVVYFDRYKGGELMLLIPATRSGEQSFAMPYRELKV